MARRAVPMHLCITNFQQMTIVLVLLMVFFGLVAYFFFAPFFIEVDSTRSIYRFRFHRLLSLDLKVQEDVRMRMSLLGWKTDFKPALYKTGKKPQDKKEGVKRDFQLNVVGRKLLNVLKSFRLTKCHIRITMEDMQLNGILYPMAAWLSWYSKKDIQISFTGSNVVIVEIKNNLARMSWAWFSSSR